MSANALAPIIIKRKKIIAAEHHGGAWKVAMSVSFVRWRILRRIFRCRPLQADEDAILTAADPASAVARHPLGCRSVLGENGKESVNIAVARPAQLRKILV